MAGVPAEDLVHLGPHPDQLLGLDGQVRQGAPGLTGRLVQQHPGVPQHRPLAGVPAASSTAAADAACPMQNVATSGRMNCIVS